MDRRQELARGRGISRTVLSAILLLSPILAWGTVQYENVIPASPNGDETTLLTFAHVSEAWQYSKGKRITVAVLDWQFDPNSPARDLYVSPGSVVPGEVLGNLKPWHGAWMVEIVHAVAPEASIMPIITRGLRIDYADYLPAGIRYAADHGASVVSSSMGPVYQNQALRDAVEYARARGCIFVDVHPERISEMDQKPRSCRAGECLDSIIHPGVVSVPAHPIKPEDNRDIYAWPYDLDTRFDDGWGFSNAPPTVAGVIALMLGANRNLQVSQVKRLLIETAVMKDSFRILNAEAAVRGAAKR